MDDPKTFPDQAQAVFMRDQPRRAAQRLLGLAPDVEPHAASVRLVQVLGAAMADAPPGHRAALLLTPAGFAKIVALDPAGPRERGDSCSSALAADVAAGGGRLTPRLRPRAPEYDESGNPLRGYRVHVDPGGAFGLVPIELLRERRDRGLFHKQESPRPPEKAKPAAGSAPRRRSAPEDPVPELPPSLSGGDV